nr:MAG TPA: hypothetical protein [Caudoviricetes sp.]
MNPIYCESELFKQKIYFKHIYNNSKLFSSIRIDSTS